jgi:hypothetical protein
MADADDAALALHRYLERRALGVALLWLSERRRIADKNGAAVDGRDFIGRRLELRPALQFY